MYEELKKQLKELGLIAEFCGEQRCFECKNKDLCDKYENKMLSDVYKNAARAIERLELEVAALQTEAGGNVMGKEYIEREAFLKQKREQYCKDCSRRKGMRNGKYKTLYEIGEAPCRACAIDDVLNDVEDFPAADVRPVKRGKWTLNKDGSGTCSECGFVQSSCWDLDNWDNFCHHCGADMREKADG